MTNSGCQLMLYQRGQENYALLYERKDPASAMRTLGRWAMNPELAFTWHDATVMSLRVRRLALADGIGTFSHGGFKDVNSGP
jgi:hypothetical protein